MLRVIEHGLEGTEQMIVSGLSRARDGSLVRPVGESAARNDAPAGAAAP
jgi:hypothetical protein